MKTAALVVAGLAASASAQLATVNISATRTEIDPGESVDFVVSFTGDQGLFRFDVELLAQLTGDTTLTYSDLEILQPSVTAGVHQNPFGDAFDGNPPFTDGQSGNISVAWGVDPFVNLNNFGIPTADPDWTAGGQNDLFTFTVTATGEGTFSFDPADGDGGNPAAFEWTNEYTAAWVATAYTDVVVNADTVTVVPTPGTMAILGLGGLAATRRRR